MKTFILMIICFYMVATQVFGQSKKRIDSTALNQFYDKVLSAPNTNGGANYFIALQVRSDEYIGNVMLEWDNFLGIIYIDKHIDSSLVEMTMKDIAKNHKVLDMGNLKLKNYRMLLAPGNSPVFRKASFGVKGFLNTYFDNPPYYFMKYVSDSEVGPILFQLFGWGIGAFRDDESGQIRLDNYKESKRTLKLKSSKKQKQIN